MVNRLRKYGYYSSPMQGYIPKLEVVKAVADIASATSSNRPFAVRHAKDTGVAILGFPQLVLP